MAMKRIKSSWRGAERGNKATPAQNGQPAPSLHTYPADDYPVFPEDKSAFPVWFPDLPPAPDGGPRRPPRHVSLAEPPNIPADQKPNHVALVMDGNGRWATQRGLPRTEGHKMGEVVLLDIICGAIELGIKWLTVFAFSTENWKRSPEEVRFLMGFNRDVVRRRRVILDQMGVRMRWAGQRPRMWRSVIKELEIGENMTLNNDVITVTLCVNYGGRAEIAEATRQIARQVAEGRLNPDRITEATITRNLHYPDMPDVDLFVRSSGEQRSSNFLIWQSAYAEYVFHDKLWPDYDRRDLWAACEEYVNRNRRFGRA